ncbi:MAG TPA: POTRA domain-containing protein, partial [Kofleriaceae bacterium]|nr:POTRA domain-containing protein [Kofleriaceae bacterium]
MPCRWLLVVIVCALGCGGSSAVRPRGTAWLAKIKLEGNTALDDDDVLPRLALDRARRGGRAVDLYQLELDTERVRQAYVRKGYFDAKVTSRVDQKGDAQTVVFQVVEGKRSRTRVVFVGLPPEVDVDKARALVP